MENITPRQAPFLLDRARFERNIRTLEMLAVFHAKKPEDLKNKLLQDMQPVRKPKTDTLKEMIRLAEDTGNKEAAKRLRRLAFVAPFTRGGKANA